MTLLKHTILNITHPVITQKNSVRCHPSQEGTEPKSPFEGGAQFIGRGMFVLSFLLLFIPHFLGAQDYSQTINRTAVFDSQSSSNTLKVYNINGSVSVKGYDGNEIQITAEQHIDGSSREVARAKNELEFIVEKDGDIIYVYVDAPFIDLKKDDERFSYRIDRWDDDYEFLHDITINVPRNTHIHASTINRGSVRIENTLQTISASNINGKVRLYGIHGKTRARTVNGDITVEYAKSPEADSDYKTVNGEINVSYPTDLSADIRFKSLHGDLYTDFENIERLKAQVKEDKRRKHGGITYRIDRFSPIRIGNGGPTFNFEVLNGDVYIKKIKS